MVRTDQEDQDLLTRVAAREVLALEALYDRFSSLVFSIGLYITKDEAAAEEITQDVFTQIWHKAGLYRPEKGKVLSWITRMTRNRAIDELRRLRIRPEGHYIDQKDELPDLSTSEEPGPEQILEILQQREAIIRALDSLPQDQRRALILAYFFGYSHQKIANLLDEPLGTVKTRLRLAIIKLRNMMELELLQRSVNPKPKNLR